MKTAVITQSNYIPWKGYFDQIRAADSFVLYDCVQYTKRDWRNRNKIKTAQGLQWLSIPVLVKGKFFQSIRDTKVSENTWAKKHWKSISHAYSQAPFFSFYKDLFEDLYHQAEALEYLSEINFLFLSEICKLLSITTEFSWSESFEQKEDRTEKLAHICTQLGATHYFSGPLAQNYMDESIFNERGITVQYFDYQGYPEYPQVHGDFEHGVSILDLLFSVGPESPKYLHPHPLLPISDTNSTQTCAYS